MIDQKYRYSTDKVIETVQNLIKLNPSDINNFNYEYNTS